MFRPSSLYSPTKTLNVPMSLRTLNTRIEQKILLSLSYRQTGMLFSYKNTEMVLPLNNWKHVSVTFKSGVQIPRSHLLIDL